MDRGRKICIESADRMGQYDAIWDHSRGEGLLVCSSALLLASSGDLGYVSSLRRVSSTPMILSKYCEGLVFSCCMRLVSRSVSISTATFWQGRSCDVLWVMRGRRFSESQGWSLRCLISSRRWARRICYSCCCRL